MAVMKNLCATSPPPASPGPRVSCGTGTPRPAWRACTRQRRGRAPPARHRRPADVKPVLANRGHCCMTVVSDSPEDDDEDSEPGSSIVGRVRGDESGQRRKQVRCAGHMAASHEWPEDRWPAACSQHGCVCARVCAGEPGPDTAERTPEMRGGARVLLVLFALPRARSVRLASTR